MQYEVRYQVSGDEFAATVDADDAATAARLVHERHASIDEQFELIQVHLLSEPGDASADDLQSDDDLILS